MAGVGRQDPEARFAHLAEGNARQARKRVAADVVIRDERGRVLLVDPTYKDGWDLPGGMVEENESPRAGARRELSEELALTIEVGRPLVVEWVDAHGPWDDQIVFVFDGGVLPASVAATLRIADGELAGWEFVTVEAAENRLRVDLWRRLRRACDALGDGGTGYQELDGRVA